MLLSLVAAAVADEPVLVASALVPEATAEAAEAPEPAVWAGEQVTEAIRRVPVIGQLRSTTTIRTIARVVEQDGELVIVDRPCTIDIVSAGGVTLDFDDEAVHGMPPAT